MFDISLATLGLFAITVIPLICTPGPDILFTASQGLVAGRRGAMRAVVGVLSGYTAHAVLAALGLAALVQAYPALYLALKWAGVAYIAYLAVQTLRSALRAGGGIALEGTRSRSIAKGFLTSFLNPKGLLMYLAILPQFLDPSRPLAGQALALSGLFLMGCAVVYTAVGLLAARAGTRGGIGDRTRRWTEGVAGGLLAGAAVKMASA